MASPTLRYFDYTHLPLRLQAVVAPFKELATICDNRYPDGAEKSAGLRKLLEAKDCMVRAALDGEQEQQVAEAYREPGTTNVFMLHSHGLAQHSHADGNLQHTHDNGDEYEQHVGPVGG